ncbi:adenylate/guanylate cyclase domain-containing protein [Streptomyces sp. NBC_00102]|uniref:adenylate/guanylate cyclase domain-containing protein n=1 Tax=Streptomyces sp. NBC_00102 TaxID=2975652 RepID=UPI00225B09F5|nr:adenylate/guanylate cyclase domain-containing protein [Streptomyces sp. NBC_00102]MCX5398687.1 AAA family ATPase [Streptomyces sp. NBC_00102]
MPCTYCHQPLPSGARFCPSCGTPCAEPPQGSADAPQEGRKVVTVLFCDMVGSTALSGALDPETLRGVTLRYFELMGRQIEAYGGTVEKFIGDAVMAVFGVPTVREDDARRALAASLGMLKALDGLNADLDATLGVRLGVRIGINTGRVVAGSDSSARQALVSGETVNIAARLEQNAGPGEVLIGPDTLLAAGPTVRAQEVGPLVLKGKTDRVVAHRLLGLGEDDPESLRRFDLRFVGRQRELAALDEALAGTAAGGGARLVTVSGEAGQGKTRLVREWLERTTAAAATHGAGRCRPYGGRGSLAPLADALADLLPAHHRPAHPGTPFPGTVRNGSPVDGSDPDGSRFDGSAPEGTYLEGSEPDGSVPDRTEPYGTEPYGTEPYGTEPYGTGTRRTARGASTDRPCPCPLHRAVGPAEHPALSEALAVLEGGLLLDGTPNPSVDDTCGALLRVLTALAARRPVVLVVDDCQWAAPLLLEVLDRLVARLGAAAVLVVCTARPEAAETWSTSRRTAVTLTGLAPEECALLAAELVVRADRLPDGPALLERTGGNPLHLEHLLSALDGGDGRDGGRGDGDGGNGGRGDGDGGNGGREYHGGAGPGGPGGNGLRRSPERSPELPPTVQALLGARVDALGPVDRGALDLAAVLGREFTAHELTDLAVRGTPGRPALDPPALRPALLGLGRRRLIEPVPPPADPASYRFTSGLVQEVAYQCMSKRTRADLHAGAATLPSVRSAGPAGIGEHLELAHRYRRELGITDADTEALRRAAAEALAEAGSRALDRSDLLRAEHLLSRAHALNLPGESATVPTARRLGEVNLALGRTERGRTLLSRALAALDHPEESAYARLALAVDAAPGADAVPDAARAVLPVFEAAADDLGQARACLRLAQHYQGRGRHGEADRLLLRALRRAVVADAEPERAAALGAIGVSLWRGPEPVESAVYRCRALLAEHGRGRRTVQVTLNLPLAVLLALRDEHDAAREHLALAGRLADELGFAEAGVFLPLFGAAVHSAAREHAAALGLLGEAARAARALGARTPLRTITLESARLHLDTGDAEEARRVLDGDAGQSVADGGLDAETADHDGLRARLAAGRGDADRALRLAARSVRAADRTDSPLVRAQAALDEALTLRLLGLGPESANAAGRAGQWFGTKGHAPGVRWAAALLPAGSTAPGGPPAPGSVREPDVSRREVTT